MTFATDDAPSRTLNVSDLLRSAAREFAGRPAVVFGGGHLTWFELDSAAAAGSRALRAAGARTGDRVVLSLPTGPEIWAALFAVARAGLIAVPVSPEADLVGIAAKVGASAVITDRVGLAQGNPALPQVVGVEQLRSWWSGPESGAATDEAGGNEAGGSDGGGDEAVAGGEDIAVLARAVSSDRPVMVSHRAILAAVAAIGAAPRLGLRSEDKVIQVLPSYHLAGWVTSFLPLCAVGAAAVVPDPIGPGTTWIQAVLATIRQHRVTVVPGAPSLYRRLRTEPGVERALASVRLMTSGAAPLDPGDSSAIRALTGQSVWEGYGISESASVVSTSLMTNASRKGSVGSPLPGLQIQIVGDDGSDLYPGVDQESDAADDDFPADTGAVGEVGRIRINGPTLFSGYWPDGSSGPDADGWFGTGDLGYLDDNGELHLVDRAAETIRIAGFTVYPREIEDVLTAHPYVRDAAVIGAPGRAGDAVVAVLVPQRGTHPTSRDLDDFVAERLPAFKRPQRYQLVERLPRTEIGRVDRDVVRARYSDELALPAALVTPAAQAAAVFASVPEPSADDLDPAGPDERADPKQDGKQAKKDAEKRVKKDTEKQDGKKKDAEKQAKKDAEKQAKRDPAKPAGTQDANRQDPKGEAGADPTGMPDQPEVFPEPAAPIGELGNRLPRTGERSSRAANDTDDDLF